MSDTNEIWTRHDKALGKAAAKFRPHHAGIYSRVVPLTDEEIIGHEHDRARSENYGRIIAQNGSIKLGTP